MKFSDVPVGARFIDKSFVKPVHIFKTPLFLVGENIDGVIEDHRANAVSVCGVYFYYTDEMEVELVTKCSNCRFLKENIETNDIVENRLYCTRYIQYSNISLSASITDNIVNLGMNKETFSCSFFEEKK